MLGVGVVVALATLPYLPRARVAHLVGGIVGTLLALSIVGVALLFHRAVRDWGRVDYHALPTDAAGEHEGGGVVKLENGRLLKIEDAANLSRGPVLLAALVIPVGPIYRASAMVPATARVTVGRRVSFAREAEGRFTATCVACAGLLTVAAVPLAVAG